MLFYDVNFGTFASHNGEFETTSTLPNFDFACRYLSYVMDVATPTKDCLDIVHDLLLPVLMKGNRKSVLSHQEV